MIKSSRTAHRYALAFLAMCILTCATLTADASADVSTGGRAVTLAQARTAPTFLSNLGAGNYVDAGDPATGYTCAHDEAWDGYYSDVSAYTWKGGAMSAQAWTNTTRTVMVWRDRSGRAVTFDGVRFRNHTDHAVMVAGWCEL